MTRSKQEDQIRKKTTTEKFRAGMRSSIKSENMYPFLFSIASKKKGKLARIPAKTAIPTQNFHLNEGISHASDHLKPKAKGLTPDAFLSEFPSFSIFLYVKSELPKRSDFSKN